MKNHFRYRNSRVYWKQVEILWQIRFKILTKPQVLTPSEESTLVAVLERDSSSSSMLFDRHFYIFNLVNLREVNFDWVNMVREPVARLVSQFHYLRYISACARN